MAFFFAYQNFYTSWLYIPAFPGLCLSIYLCFKIALQVLEGKDIDIDTPYNGIYSLIMAIWSTVFVEVWKRREAELANLWRMENYESKKHMQVGERREFKYELVIDPKKKGPQKESFVNPHARRLIGEVPAIIFGIAGIIGCFIGVLKLKDEFKNNKSSGISFFIGYVKSTIIVILSNTYQYVSNSLANWENHQFNEGWESSLSSKNFFF